jgi:hypothetical protein
MYEACQLFVGAVQRLAADAMSNATAPLRRSRRGGDSLRRPTFQPVVQVR